MLDLLEALTARRGADVTLTELADATRLQAPTASRLLRVLVDRGYVEHQPYGPYRLGAAYDRLDDRARLVYVEEQPTPVRIVAGEPGCERADEVVEVEELPPLERLRRARQRAS